MSDGSLAIYDSPSEITWCPGCGDFSVLRALKLALRDLEIAPHEALIVSGIGCGSKLPDYLGTNGFMTIHGRPLAVATGAKLANPRLNVIVVNGDGDSYGIGGNHFIHTCRRNPDITHIVENNQIYGLTKGQYSPTSPQGTVTSTSPDGSIELAFNPILMAISGGATFVARSFAGEPKHLAAMIYAGVRHRGYALIDVLQPCITFNNVNSFEWYRERVYHLDREGHDTSDPDAALRKAREWGEKIPVGIFYQSDATPSYGTQVKALARMSPVNILRSSSDQPNYERLKDRYR